MSTAPAKSTEEYLVMDRDLNVMFCGTLAQIDDGFPLGINPTEDDAKACADASGFTLYRIVR